MFILTSTNEECFLEILPSFDILFLTKMVYNDQNIADFPSAFCHHILIYKKEVRRKKNRLKSNNFVSKD